MLETEPVTPVCTRTPSAAPSGHGHFQRGIVPHHHEAGDIHAENAGCLTQGQLRRLAGELGPLAGEARNGRGYGP